MKTINLRQFNSKSEKISQIISCDDLLLLKQIHKKYTGIDLSDLDALSMGLRLMDVFSVIGQKIEFAN